MTGNGSTRLGPLGRRLLVAFVAVAFSSVAVLAAGAAVGTDLGLAAATRDEREQAAVRVAELAAGAYQSAGGWQDADLRPAADAADAAGARLVVWSTDQTMVWPGRGMGGRGTHHAETGGVEALVVVAGATVGTVRLGYTTASGTGGRAVAWAWVAGAAAVALLVALTASWLVSRRLTGPLVRMAAAARRFTAGDRAARSRVRAPGELGEVASAVDAMADEVVRVEAVRRRLAADVAHELRTPLAGLQAGLEELRDGLAHPDPQRLAGLHDQALRLGRVVDDLAELSAAESAALSLRPTDVDLAELVRSAVAGQEPTLRAAGLDLQTALNGPVRMWVDPDRVHQVVVNLLANAARYCRSGDRVSVSTTSGDGSGVVEVADTGPGISAADLPYVFQRFWRGRGSGTVAGSGIGLAVVRELVAAHGGTVTVESATGFGTRFTIRLPLESDRPASPYGLHPDGMSPP